MDIYNHLCTSLDLREPICSYLYVSTITFFYTCTIAIRAFTYLNLSLHPQNSSPFRLSEDVSRP